MNAPDSFSRQPLPADLQAQLADYLAVRRQTMALAASLSAEDCQAQSMPDASPVKWHLAHTTWFFETFLLGEFAPAYIPKFEAYRVLFNSYYNAVGQKHPRAQRGLLSRPSLAEVMSYRACVDDAMVALIEGESVKGQSGEIADRPFKPAFDRLLTLGLNHEQQHQELILTDVKHLLSCNPLGPSYGGASVAARPDDGARVAAEAVEVVEMAFRRFDGGIVCLGHRGEGFAFDNEGPAHAVLLQPFELADRLVSCGEYLAFIEDGGYRRPELWLSLGWDRVEAEDWQLPLYWRRHAPVFRDAAAEAIEAFGLQGWQLLDRNAPVAHLSFFEADAYARWTGTRLPTEAEWEHAVQHDCFTWGDLWEWTASPYVPYPGFKASAGAVGEYNGKFMCNQYVLRGGSFATPASHVRPSYRNFFPPEARWQFTGLRLARDDVPAAGRRD